MMADVFVYQTVVAGTQLQLEMRLAEVAHSGQVWLIFFCRCENEYFQLSSSPQEISLAEAFVILLELEKLSKGVNKKDLVLDFLKARVSLVLHYQISQLEIRLYPQAKQFYALELDGEALADFISFLQAMFETLLAHLGSSLALLRDIYQKKQQLRLAEVTFSRKGKAYTYICEDNSIEVGNWVYVPVGQTQQLKLAKVVKIYDCPLDELPFPADKLKTIAERCQTFDRPAAEQVVAKLKATGQVLDISQQWPGRGATAMTCQLLTTPMGHFWLSYNGQPIPMTVQLQAKGHGPYQVDGHVHIRPAAPLLGEFEVLRLCTDFDLSAARFIDSVSDEWTLGSLWEMAGLHFGVAAYETDYRHSELDCDPITGLFFYREWRFDLSDRYGFNLAWKPHISDEDLSIEFFIT